MDWLQKTIIATALGVSLVATGSARAQTRPNVLASGVGSAVAHSSTARDPNAIFVSPQVGVAESAQPLEAYDEESAPSPSKLAPETFYAENVELGDSIVDLDASGNELLKEKMQAAEIFAKTQERAARRKHTVRAINAPMTLGALNAKPNAQPRRQASVATPQFQQYAPSLQAPPSSFQLSPGAHVVSTETGAGAENALNWDGSSKRGGGQYGRSQTPSLKRPVVYGLMTDPALATSGNPNATPNRSEVSDAVAQETDANAADSDEIDLSAELAAPPQDALTTSETLGPIDPPLVSDEELETPSIDSLPAFVPPSQQEDVELASPDETPTLETLESLDPKPEPETPQAVFQEPTLTAPAAEATANEPKIQDVPVPPIPVETVKPNAPTAPTTEEPVEIAPVAPPTVANPLPETTDQPEESQSTQQVESAEESEAPTPQSQENESDSAPLMLDAPYCSPNGYEQVNVPAPTVTTPPADNPAVSQLLARPYCQPNAFPAQPQCAQPVYASYAPCAEQMVGCSAPTCQPNAIGQSYGIPQPRGAYGFQAPYDGQTFYSYESETPSYAVAGRPYGLIAGAEWLAWRTDTDKPFARVVDNGVTRERDLQTSGSGLRGRLGFRALSGWDIVATYTWYDADKSASVAEGNAAFTSPFFPDETVDVSDSTSATLKNELQVVDLEIGRWNERGAFSFRPFAGFRWTQFNEEFANVFTTSNAVASDGVLATTSMLDDDDAVETAFSNAVLRETSNSASQSVSARSRLNAYGLRIGADVDLALTQGLSVYGKGAGTIAVGDVKTRTFQNGDAIREIKKTYATPSVEGGVGLSWKRNGFEARGGYEFNAWYNASNLNGRKSDFLAHGYVAGLGWNY